MDGQNRSSGGRKRSQESNDEDDRLGQQRRVAEEQQLRISQALGQQQPNVDRSPRGHASLVGQAAPAVEQRALQDEGYSAAVSQQLHALRNRLLLTSSMLPGGQPSPFMNVGQLSSDSSPFVSAAAAASLRPQVPRGGVSPSNQLTNPFLVGRGLSFTAGFPPPAAAAMPSAAIPANPVASSEAEVLSRLTQLLQRTPQQQSSLTQQPLPAGATASLLASEALSQLTNRNVQQHSPGAADLQAVLLGELLRSRGVGVQQQQQQVHAEPPRQNNPSISLSQAAALLSQNNPQHHQMGAGSLFDQLAQLFPEHLLQELVSASQQQHAPDAATSQSNTNAAHDLRRSLFRGGTEPTAAAAAAASLPANLAFLSYQRQRPSPAPAAAAAATAGRLSRPPEILYNPVDNASISSYQQIIRKQIEIFEADEVDVDSYAAGVNRKIVLGQVGLRCRWCKLEHPRTRARASVYYPTRLSGIYQACQNMAKNHLAEDCRCVSDEVRRELQTMQAEKASPSGGGKKYWAERAESIGVYEEPDGGLRFRS